jgi:predicted DNA-binding transcriptional regulator AlpA
MASRYLRFRDLQARGIITSWPILKRRVDLDGFPPGKKVGPNTRIWDEAEVDAWVASRPTDRKVPHQRHSDTEDAEVVDNP